MATIFNEDNTIEQMMLSTLQKNGVEIYSCRGTSSYVFGCTC